MQMNSIYISLADLCSIFSYFEFFTCGKGKLPLKLLTVCCNIIIFSLLKKYESTNTGNEDLL